VSAATARDALEPVGGARLAGPDRLRVDIKLPAWQERAGAVRDILRQLAA